MLGEKVYAQLFAFGKYISLGSNSLAPANCETTSVVVPKWASYSLKLAVPVSYVLLQMGASLSRVLEPKVFLMASFCLVTTHLRPTEAIDQSKPCPFYFWLFDNFERSFTYYFYLLEFLIIPPMASVPSHVFWLSAS